MDDLLTADDHTIARRMNEEVELLVGPHAEQYTWILKLLKTRKPGEKEPYKRKELYPGNKKALSRRGLFNRLLDGHNARGVG
jgi:hypothetical protein